MADDILSKYQHIIDQFTFITGTKGAFEFRIDGELVFSKKTIQNRHAEPGEILTLFRDFVGEDVPTYPQK